MSFNLLIALTYIRCNKTTSNFVLIFAEEFGNVGVCVCVYVCESVCVCVCVCVRVCVCESV